MRNIFRLTGLSAALLVGVSFSGVVSAVSLPAANCGATQTSNCLQFEDFNVYSLSYLNYMAGAGTAPKSGDPYYVKSAGADITNALVILTSPGGRIPNSDLGLGNTVDDAYNSANNNPQASSANFVMAGADPAGAPTGDNSQATTQKVYGVPGFADGSTQTLNLWDIQTSALRTYLNGGALTFFFNLNETNPGGLDDGQDMYAWMRVTLSGIAGVKTFDLSGNITSPLPFQSANQTDGSAGVNRDDILPTVDDKWAHVHGEICVSTSLGLVGLRPCQAGDPADAKTVNQNLGADIAAFALFNKELNDLVQNAGSGYDLMTVDARMAHVDNGYEQLFIRAVDMPKTNVPEPGVLAILGAGLFAFGVSRRSKRKNM